MTRLCEELQLGLDRHVIWVGHVNSADTLNDLVNILFNFAFSTQVALIVELWVTYVANILLQILPDAVC